MVKHHKYLLLILLCLVNIPAALAANEKVVYHIHQTQADTLKRAINNIENLKKGMPGKSLDIRLLMQGNSIQLLNPSLQDKTLMALLLKLRDSGLHIEVSEKNYRQNRLQIESSLKPLLVENFFSRLVELQNQGYRYLTP